MTDLHLPPMSDQGLHASVPGSNVWGVPMAASTVRLDNGKVLTYDDIVFGMNRLWQDLGLWMKEKWHGVTFMQNPNDAILIQQLLWSERPSLVLEIGTHAGGAALFYAGVMRAYEAKPGDTHLLTMDPASQAANILAPELLDRSRSPNIEFLPAASFDPVVTDRIKELKR